MKQPVITKKSTVITILINMLIILIPFGVFYVLYKAFVELKRTTYPIYREVPLTKRDRRFKTGQRIIGRVKEKTGEMRDLSNDEIIASKHNGKLRLMAFGIFFALGAMSYFINGGIA